MDFEKIKQELDNCKRPLFLFHDDADGLCSFLMFYRYKQEGKGMPVKTTPIIDYRFVRKTKEYEPDKIFVLDVAKVEQEYIDEVKTPIVWVDHHDLLKRQNIVYLNPKSEDPEAYIPASDLCYKIINDKEDEWIATIGCIGDYYVPEYIKKIKEKYNDLFETEVDLTKPNEIRDQTKFGKLVKIFEFVLKGKTQDVIKSIKVLTRIKDPYEILNQKTPAGKFIYKRFEKINIEYEKILDQAKKEFKKNKELVNLFVYEENKISLSSYLSNQLISLYPQKLLIIGRKSSDEIKCSLRHQEKNVKQILEKALKGIDGYGGGHEHACAAIIKEHDFKRFIENIKLQI